MSREVSTLGSFETPLGSDVSILKDPDLGEGFLLKMKIDMRSVEVYLSLDNAKTLLDLISPPKGERKELDLEIVEMLKTLSVALDVNRLSSGLPISGGSGEKMREFIKDVEELYEERTSEP